MKKIILVLFALVLSGAGSEIMAQNLKGKVFGYDENGKKTALFGAMVRWQNSNIGAKTNRNGEFTVQRDKKSDKLNISYVGYLPLEEQIDSKTGYVEVQLEINKTQTVEVVGRQSAIIMRESAINTQEITLSGLRKAACCNLAESFVANPSVDVNYSDAVTGAKQIELLGLEGTYTQMMTNNIPNLRGLGATYGLNYVPGQWMEAIQISKGAASVTGGFESITGQINVDYKLFGQARPLLVNLYGSTSERIEGDVVASIPVAEGLTTNVFAHANYNEKEIDDNDDSFLDMPLEEQYTLMNSWNYEGNGLHTAHIIKALNETRQAGQTGYFSNDDKSKYGIQIKTERYELLGKVGYVLPTEAYNSLAVMYSLSSHNQNSFFGNNKYHGNQKSGYAKVLFETRWGTKEHHHDDCCEHEHGEACEHDHEGEHEHHHEAEHEHHHDHEAEHDHEGEHEHHHEGEEIEHAEHAGHGEANTNIHSLNLGASFNFDQFDETYHHRLNGSQNFADTLIDKIERTPGVFAEYTYSGIDNLAIIAGARMDFHNIYGNFFTPRFHVKYAPFEEFSMRVSAGKGYHINNIFAENSAIMASSRSLYVEGDLDPEEAWNYGINASYTFELFSKKFTVNADYYRTDFINQVVVDMERSANAVYFYNLDGDSYSNSYQLDLSFAPVENFDVMMAYRYNDVKMTYDGKLIEKPLQSRYKAFVNLAYALEPWDMKFDFTTVLNGGGSLPNTQNYPEQYRLGSNFHSFLTMQAQITKTIGDFEIYLGGENLTNHTQDMPILGCDAPFGDFFDTSIVYAPIMGRKFYAGIRWNAL